MTNTQSNDTLYLIALLILVTFFAFFKANVSPITDGYESRNGINAIEMIQSGNYFELTYGQEKDYWNVKPPLGIWVTATSINVFGRAHLPLRIPVAIATIVSFLFLFKIIRKYQEADFAFFTCLMLISIKGILGRHIEYQGEFDALWLCFTLIATYHFLNQIDFKHKKSVYWSALFLGLAFFVKGFGILAIVIGFGIYTLFRKRLVYALSTGRFWFAVALFCLFPMLWVAGNDFDFYNTLVRNFNQEFLNYTFQVEQFNALLFFKYLNELFFGWNYIFYLALPVAFYLLIANRQSISKHTSTALSTERITLNSLRRRIFTVQELLDRPELKPSIPLLVFSICIWSVLAIICTLSQNEQYLAFALPFIAITTAAGIFYLNHRYRIASWIFVGMLLFTFWVQLEYYLQPQTLPFVTKHRDLIERTQGFSCDSELPTQTTLCYLKLFNPPMTIVDGSSAFTDAVFCSHHRIHLYPDMQIYSQDEHYAILIKVYQ